MEKFANNWDKSELKLALENYPPLRELIRQIAQGGHDLGEVDAHPAADSQPSTAASGQGDRAQELATAQAEIDQLQTQLTAALNGQKTAADKLQEIEPQFALAIKTVKDLTAQGKQAAQENRDLQTQLDANRQALADAEDAHQKALSKAKKAQDALQEQLRAATQPHPMLQLLRQDSELGAGVHSDLAHLPTDPIAALIQLVAVLSQSDNLLRLWQTIKDRCDSQQRPAADAELQLLHAALGWHNYNWPKRPYTLIDAAVRGSYDFDRHNRSKHSPSGEKIAQLLLPGLADGSGKAIGRALVCTAA